MLHLLVGNYSVSIGSSFQHAIMNLPITPAPLLPDADLYEEIVERRRKSKDFLSVAKMESDGAAQNFAKDSGCAFEYPCTHTICDDLSIRAKETLRRKRSRQWKEGDSPSGNVSFHSSPTQIRKRPEDPSTPVTCTTSTTLASTLADTDPNFLVYSDTPWVDPSLSFHSLLEWAAVECLEDAEESRMQVEFVERTAKEMQDIVQYWYLHDSKLQNEERLQRNTLWSLYQDDNQETENDVPFCSEEEDNYSEEIEGLFQSIVPMKLQSCREDEEEDFVSPELLNQLYDAESMRRWQILQVRLVRSDDLSNVSNVPRRCYNILALLLLFSSMMIVSKIFMILHGMSLVIMAVARDAFPPDSLEVAVALLVVLMI